MTVRILIVEDVPELAQLIVAGVRAGGFTADPIATLDDARHALHAIAYDALVLDLSLPDGDGVALLTELRRRRSPIPVLILTARDAPESRVDGLDAGADDYLVKPFHMAELVARLKALLRRPGQVLGLRLAAGNLVFDTVARQTEVDGRPLLLGRRESGLLESLLRNAGRVVPKDRLDERLYGFGEEVGSNAVEVVVHRLRRKLEQAGASARIHTLRGVGYLMTEPVDGDG
jgi:DNA-binding response OmpR family regulator